MSRTNLQIKVGTYTGNGSDDRIISGIGFEPHLVILKGGANHSVFKTKWMNTGNAGYFANNVADLANSIQLIDSDGFQVGTDVTANENGTTYYYVAIRGVSGQNYFRTGKYLGTGADDRNYTGGALGFTPDFVFTKKDGTDLPSLRTTEVVGDLSWHTSGTIDVANEIQSLISGGFQLGSSSRVNTSGSYYNFFALKKFAGCIATGTFTGTGTDSRNITGIGFQPDFVLLKNGGNTGQARIKTSDLAGDSALPVGGAAAGSDWIQSIISDGFQVGTSGNANGNTHYWVAFKTGNYNVPITRTLA